MKKAFFSLGMAAAGTASLHASDLLTTTDTKVWTVGATLRGFYDDNYTTTTKKVSSYGFEVSPGFSLDKPFQQTELGIRYNYGFYENFLSDGRTAIDQSHQFDLWLDHAFTPRLELQLADTVRVSQEPTIGTSPTSVTKRISGSNLANTLNLSLRTDWTRTFATAFMYQNNFIRYDNRGWATNGVAPPFVGVTPSYAGLLDRVEQTFAVQGQYKFSPKTTGTLSYAFGLVNFTAGEHIAYNTNTASYYDSSSRDNMQHSVTVGVNHSFLENLSGSADVGVSYATYYNDPSATSAFGPKADLSLNYTYAPGSYAQVGFSETRNATDAINVNSKGQITQDQESSSFYFSINHSLTAKLKGSVVGHYQHGIYHDSDLNNKTSDFYNLGLNLNYQWTRHFGSDIGYNFDYYTSAAGGNYTRNRIYLGVSAMF